MTESKSGRFNGTIKADSGPVKVVEGYAIMDGDFFLVSDDGKVITDKEGNIEAVVENGTAMPLTPEVINELRRKGYIE